MNSGAYIQKPSHCREVKRVGDMCFGLITNGSSTWCCCCWGYIFLHWLGCSLGLIIHLPCNLNSEFRIRSELAQSFTSKLQEPTGARFHSNSLIRVHHSNAAIESWPASKMKHDGHQGRTVHLIAHYKVCNHFTKKPARTTTMKSSSERLSACKTGLLCLQLEDKLTVVELQKSVFTPSKAFICGSGNPPLWECLWNNIKPASLIHIILLLSPD